MKLEEGKRYRTRDGRETEPLEERFDPVYLFEAEVNGSRYTWTKHGLFDEPYSQSNLDLVEEIEESEEKPKIDYDKMSKDLANIATVSGRPVQYDADLYDLETKEDGTIILKPSKRKIWIEVYEYDGVVLAIGHTTKDDLNKSLEAALNGETLLEVIEREYPINKENR